MAHEQNEACMAVGWGKASLKQVRVCVHVPVFVDVSHGQVWVAVHLGLL